MSSLYFLVGHEEPQSSNTDAQATKCTLGKINSSAVFKTSRVQISSDCE